MDNADLPAPTTVSNAEAAALACKTERDRVLGILALANPPVDGNIADAIARGANVAAMRRRLTGAASPATSASGAAADAAVPHAPAPEPASHPWAAITRRYPRRQRTAKADTP